VGGWVVAGGVDWGVASVAPCAVDPAVASARAGVAPKALGSAATIAMQAEDAATVTAVRISIPQA